LEELTPLVTAARGGDLEAYARLVRRFQDMAYDYAHVLLGDRHLAEDAAQDAFIEAYRCLGKLREPEAFPGWFRRIVLGRCRRLTRRKRLPTVPLPSAEAVAAGGPGPPEQAQRREMAAAVLAAVRSLPEAERTVTTLFYIDGYSHSDIAEFLEVPVTTVNNRLHASGSGSERRW
jgi:RNA polymerase sigma factor (sigma-70 family)